MRYKGIVCERCGVEVTRSKVRRERMGHIDLAAPVSHIWFFKGVPSRIGYLLDMAPKELEKVLYFAASIVTWVDDEARERDLDSLEGQVNEVLDAYAAEKEERILELRESLARREQYLESGKTGRDFSDDDHLWAESLDVNIAKLSDEEREKILKDLRKSFQADIDDTEAYIEDAAERMRQVWDLFKAMKPKDVVNDETTFRELKDRFGSPFGFGEYFRGGMGAEAVRDLLQQVDLDDEAADLQDQVKTAKGQKQARAVKRLKVVSAFLNSGNKPEMMILEAVPVIPPELRPMVQLDGGRFATSDLNDLYRRVINRNNRLKRLLDLGAPEIIVNNEKRMLQEAVDALFDNGRRGRPVTGPGNRPLKSLSDMLKGKQGRFRQNLLGKRVDYSGRSVIVAGPSLRLHQCGLPKLMALELFKPFIMARLVERKSAQNIKAAKKMVDSMIPEVWDVLEEVIHEHPVLLNRAPTLHRLGIQAFEPVLVEGKAIQVHPLVCHAFNADFDGDQMAVHLPLSAEAQAEARILMLSANNILSPAHGAPLATPAQDMVLGAYYLTYGPDESALAKIEPAKADPRPHVYRTAQEAEWSYEHGVTKLHDLAEFRPPGLEGGHLLTTVGRIIYNDKIERALAEALGDQFDPASYEFINRSMRKKDTTKLVDDLVQAYGAPTISQVLDAFKDIGFHYATQAGVTISKNDVQTPPTKAEILARYDAELADDRGAVRRRRDGPGGAPRGGHRAVGPSHQRGRRGAERPPRRAQPDLHDGQLGCPRLVLADPPAGRHARPDGQPEGRDHRAADQGQLHGRPDRARVLHLDPRRPQGSRRHGAAYRRLGLPDPAPGRRRPGRDHPPGGLRHRGFIEMPVSKLEPDPETRRLRPTGEPNDNLIGRIAAEDLTTKRGRVIVAKGEEIDRAELADLVEAWAQATPRRARWSPCRCARCSSARRRPASARPATAARWPPASWRRSATRSGIIAAQSIGEPGTQLTMRTFHTGGVAGADITHGLPRVVELFEARKPKGLAKIAEVGGKVSIEETDKSLTVVITDDGGEEHRHTFPRRTLLYVESGQQIEPGTQLNEGSLYPARAAGHPRAGPRPSCTSSARCRRSTSPRASTSTTSTSS